MPSCSSPQRSREQPDRHAGNGACDQKNDEEKQHAFTDIECLLPQIVGENDRDHPEDERRGQKKELRREATKARYELTRISKFSDSACYPVEERMTSGRLETRFCGIALRNPVIAASGTFGYGVEFKRVTDLTSLGAFVVKGISRTPMNGNPAPRVWEAEAGMINSIGLQNIGR